MTRNNDEISYSPVVELGDKYDSIARISSILAHKINNPLTFMTNYLFILKQTAADSKSLEMINKIEQGVHLTRDLLQALVDASRPSFVADEDIDVRSLIQDVLAHLPLDIEGLIIKTDIPKDICVRVERNSLMTALTSIVINAIEAGTTEIAFAVSVKGNTVSIKVRDKGRGISPNAINLIFEPFFTTKEGHLGLDLYRALHTIKSLGGSISVRSWSSSAGSEFSIELPAN